LLARIKAQLRRLDTTPDTAQDQLRFGGLEIDSVAKSVILDASPVSLSSTEFDLLWTLASHAGEVMHRNDLVQLLRGFDYDGFDRTIDVRVSRLRKKLGDTGKEPERIKTVWGKGYLFVPGAWG
jgi:DNA-binding response OmpR family regulator